MTVTTKVPVGADTLNRKWCVDVNVGTHDSPDWTGIFGITESKPIQTATTQDSSDFDGGGWKNSTVTAQEWGLEGKVRRGVTVADGTAYDPGQEILRLASIEMGLGNELEVRIYEDSGNAGPTAEAYQGYVGVTWEPEGGGMDATAAVSFKLLGHGKRNAITHPRGTGVPTATVSLLSPNTAGTSGGDLIIITGTGFMGATDVQVDSNSVPAVDWEVVSGTKIAFKAPANSASALDVTVVNATGTSATSGSTELTYS